MKRVGTTVAVLSLAAFLGIGAAAEVPENIKALVRKNCIGCHKGKNPPKGLNLEPANLAAVIDSPSSEAPGSRIIDSRSPETSYLLKKVRRQKDIAGRPMPPGKALTKEEVGALEAWIAGLK